MDVKKLSCCAVWVFGLFLFCRSSND
jgi:hypothetical protein